jgi:hypothetical protein
LAIFEDGNEAKIDGNKERHGELDFMPPTILTFPSIQLKKAAYDYSPTPQLHEGRSNYWPMIYQGTVSILQSMRKTTFILSDEDVYDGGNHAMCNTQKNEIE